MVWVGHLAEHYLNVYLIFTHSDVTKSFVLRMSAYAFIICSAHSVLQNCPGKAKFVHV